MRLVAVDMDGTLLDPQGRIPDEFWDLYPKLVAAGVTLAPASGRQLATLRDTFTRLDPQPAYIAENGTVVAVGGRVVSTTPLDPATVHRVIDAARGMVDTPPVGVVVCRPEMGYVERNEPAFLSEVARYYHAVTPVADLHEVVDEQVVKLALYTPGDAEAFLAPALPAERVVVSGRHWVDVFDPLADKGRALTALAGRLGVDLADTIAFGDYLNDLELLAAAGTSYAMANAHSRVLAAADRIAPSNADHGVIRVLADLIS